MAYATLSDDQILKVVAKIESTYNTSPTPAGGTDDVLAINSSTPVLYDFRNTPIVPHSSTYTYQTKDAIGARAIQIRDLKFLLQGSGTLGSAATNCFAGNAALLRACAIKMTATPTTGPIAFTPQTMSGIESAYVKIEQHGYVDTIGGVYGNVTMRGDSESEGVVCSFSGWGMYADPALTTISGFSGVDRSEQFLGATGGIKPSGGSTYNSANGCVLDSFEFNRGCPTPGRVRDAFASTGLSRFKQRRPRPTLRITLAFDTASSNLTSADIPPDIYGKTDHGVEFMYGTNPNKFRFAFPTAQALSLTHGAREGYRLVTLEYLLRHSSAESEFAIDCGNPSLAIAT